MTDPTYQTFGVRLRSARLRKGLTLTAMGLAIGRGASYYSEIENGRLECKLHVAVRLAEALGVSLTDLTKPSVGRARFEALADD